MQPGTAVTARVNGLGACRFRRVFCESIGCASASVRDGDNSLYKSTLTNSASDTTTQPTHIWASRERIACSTDWILHDFVELSVQRTAQRWWCWLSWKPGPMPGQSGVWCEDRDQPNELYSKAIWSSFSIPWSDVVAWRVTGEKDHGQPNELFSKGIWGSFSRWHFTLQSVTFLIGWCSHLSVRSPLNCFIHQTSESKTFSGT